MYHSTKDVRAVLVAGGAGYIGSHVCKALAKSGLLPVTLDSLITGRQDFVRWGPLVQAQVNDVIAVRSAVREHGITAVIDLAGSIEVGESVADPLKYYENNFACKIAFLRAVAESGVRTVVFSSSAAVYGEPGFAPIAETHPLTPKNPYGATKLAFEQLLRDFHAAGGPAYMALRYFNAAGASPDGEIGESHEPETHLIPRACFAALGQGPALEIYGNDYDTPDGTAIRDYVHVTDLAAAHVLGVNALMNGAASAALNLGNGIGTSVGEVLTCFKRMIMPVPHSFKARRAGDPARLVADASLARKVLGWLPAHTDIDSIIGSAWRWHSASMRALKVKR